MELRQLEHFLAVAEERNFTRAARRTHIVQSGLSTSIRTLEQELGASLFVRRPRAVSLTPSGEAFLPEARRALAAVSSARTAVMAVEGLLRGQVSLGAMQVTGVVDLPRILADFRRRHPSVEIRLRQAGSMVLLDEVQSGRLELAFVGIKPESRWDLDFLQLSEEPLLVACPADHPLAGHARVSVARLAEETFVDFPVEFGLRVATDRLFAQQGIRRRVDLEVNDVGLLLDLVAGGLGVAVVPREVGPRNPGVRYVPLRPVPMWQLSVVSARGPLSPAARVLIQIIRAHTRR